MKHAFCNARNVRECSSRKVVRSLRDAVFSGCGPVDFWASGHIPFREKEWVRATAD